MEEPETSSEQDINNLDEIRQNTGTGKRKAMEFEESTTPETNKKVLNPSNKKSVSQKNVLSLEDIDIELQKTDEELKKINLNEITFKKTNEVMAILSEKCGITNNDKSSKDISLIRDQQKESQTKLQSIIAQSSQTLKKYQIMLENSEKIYKDTQEDLQKMAKEIEDSKCLQSKDRACMENTLKIYSFLGFKIYPLENQWIIEYKDAKVVLEVKNGDNYKVIESNIALAYKNISYRSTELFTQVFKRIVLSQKTPADGNNEMKLEI
ncbi:hypothetical protein SteCoe_24817 [Stentor coeruleus]|uniref:Kinetochore protein SPC25 n=1 Tax=Stentor coeruleus TaxID=5963 RepID=A0A1R2BGM6_9CILI|nr:hypothetical protein SteCoe_24817 [Stentor coeruleus]